MRANPHANAWERDDFGLELEARLRSGRGISEDQVKILAQIEERCELKAKRDAAKTRPKSQPQPIDVGALRRHGEDLERAAKAAKAKARDVPPVRPRRDSGDR